MVGFGRSLAKEVARDHIRVNILAPGFIETDMTDAVSAGARSRIEDATVLGRFGTSTKSQRQQSSSARTPHSAPGLS